MHEQDKKTESKSSDFLLPSERKYPFKANGKISADLLKATIVQAGKDGNNTIKQKASEIFNDHFI